MIQLITTFVIKTVEDEVNYQQLQQFEQRSDNNNYGM